LAWISIGFGFEVKVGSDIWVFDSKESKSLRNFSFLIENGIVLVIFLISDSH
jgi:hypothetical protein